MRGRGLDGWVRVGLVLTALLLLPWGAVSGATTPTPVSRAKLGDPSALAKGKLLVANRDLRDPNFSRTVVLLVRYSARGTLGFIINRPTSVELSEVLPSVEEPGGGSPVFEGGPVARDLLQAVVRSSAQPPDADRVFGEIYYGRSSELVQWLLGEGKAKSSFRAYAGHAGWAPGQLENEVRRGDWYIVPTDAETVLDAEPGTLWRRLIPRDPSRSAERTEPSGSIGPVRSVSPAA